jgi:hypothetical protein
MRVYRKDSSSLRYKARVKHARISKRATPENDQYHILLEIHKLTTLSHDIILENLTDHVIFDHGSRRREDEQENIDYSASITS